MCANRLLLGAAVVVLVVAGAAGPAVAQSVDPADESEICPGQAGNNVVVVLPGDRYVYPDEEIALFPRSEAAIVLCSGGNAERAGTAWTLNEDVTGLSVGDPGEVSYPVTVATVDEPVTVDFAAAIDEREDVNAPDVTATPGRVAIADVGDDGPYRISFTESARMDSFTEASGQYATVTEEMRSAAERLNESASSGSVDTETVSQVNQTQSMTRRYTSIQSALFSAATSGDADAVAALGAYADHRNETLATISTDLRGANAALAARARSAATEVLLNLAGLFVVGAIIGGVGGRVATNRIMQRVEGKRRRSSAHDFRPRHLAAQIGVAFLALVGAVGLLVALGLLDPLVAVIRAVIGV